MNPRRHLVAIGLALAVLALALAVSTMSRPDLGAILVLLVVGIGVWILVALVLLLREKGRQERLFRLLVWVPTVIVAYAAMKYRNAEVRDRAHTIVAAIEAHKARSGAFPKGLEDIGQDPLESKKKLGLTYTLAQDGTASLFYSSPTMMLVAYHYDFSTRQWRTQD